MNIFTWKNAFSISTFALMVSVTPVLYAQTNEQLKERIVNLEDSINYLEATLDNLSEKTGDRAIVQAFDGIQLDIGGFLHSTYTYIDGENDSLGSFNRQNFELLIGAELSESWSAFIASGFLREANDPFVVGDRESPQFDTNNRNPLIIGWANYRHSDSFNIRFGRLITPHGVINLEHFPATLPEPEQPQFLRPFGGNTLFPNFSTGIQTHGNFFSESGTFNYSAYVTNATGIGGITKSNSEEIIGGRFAYTSSSDFLSVGLNYSNSYRGTTDSDNTMSGVDLWLRGEKLSLKSEYYETSEDLGGDREAYYIQPIINLNSKWLVFYRYDFLNAGDVNGESTENVIGLNYLPNNNITLRFTYTQKDFEEGFSDATLSSSLPDASANIMQLSGTFSF